MQSLGDGISTLSTFFQLLFLSLSQMKEMTLCWCSLNGLKRTSYRRRWRSHEEVVWRPASFTLRLLLIVFRLARQVGICFYCLNPQVHKDGCDFEFIHLMLIIETMISYLNSIQLYQQSLFLTLNTNYELRIKINHHHYFLVDLKICSSRLGFFSFMISLIFNSLSSAFSMFFLSV